VPPCARDLLYCNGSVRILTLRGTTMLCYVQELAQLLELMTQVQLKIDGVKVCHRQKYLPVSRA
jgi:hypothetical protein